MWGTGVTKAPTSLQLLLPSTDLSLVVPFLPLLATSSLLLMPHVVAACNLHRSLRLPGMGKQGSRQPSFVERCRRVVSAAHRLDTVSPVCM